MRKVFPAELQVALVMRCNADTSVQPPPDGIAPNRQISGDFYFLRLAKLLGSTADTIQTTNHLGAK